jgi:hypothetical protein
MAMKQVLFFIFLSAGFALFAQDVSFSLAGKKLYQELPNPAKTPFEEWSKVGKDINVHFASDNIRYSKERVPQVSSTEWKVSAWKGEKVHTQILVWTKTNIPEVSFTTGDLVSDIGKRISRENIKAAFVRYVMTDEFGKGCDNRKMTDYDSSLVADPIDIIDRLEVQPNTVQPIWLSIQVPGDVPAGNYSGTITIKAKTKFELKISLVVLDHQLPPASKWKYDLDLWQSPNPIAAVHDVKLWSDEHFALMNSYFTLLAAAGQKTISANIINQPWGRDHVHFEESTLINWTKRKDGNWFFDYSVFDRYISMMVNCGIDKRINCYSMVTWNLTFFYFDEASGETRSISAKPGSPEYNSFWTPMLRDFTRHLKSKGWFEMAAIAMDERDVESMKAVIDLLKTIDPQWKTALAGLYHAEIEKDIYDYCITESAFPEAVLNRRKAEGKPSTFYTCCNPERPNGFTFSPPAENVWIGWYAAAEGYTGYLRWAYNNWTKATLTDTRFIKWPAGDCYLIYPGPRSSIRFEKLREGIQDFEKIRILREQFVKERDSLKIKKLDDILAAFTMKNLDSIPAAEMVRKAKMLLKQIDH